MYIGNYIYLHLAGLLRIHRIERNIEIIGKNQQNLIYCMKHCRTYHCSTSPNFKTNEEFKGMGWIKKLKKHNFIKWNFLTISEYIKIKEEKTSPKISYILKTFWYLPKTSVIT